MQQQVREVDDGPVGAGIGVVLALVGRGPGLHGGLPGGQESPHDGAGARRRRGLARRESCPQRREIPCEEGRPGPSEDGVSCRLTAILRPLRRELELDVAVQNGAGVPDVREHLPVRGVLERPHQCGLEDLVLGELLTAGVHHLEIVVEVRAHRKFGAQQPDMLPEVREVVAVEHHLLIVCRGLPVHGPPAGRSDRLDGHPDGVHLERRPGGGAPTAEGREVLPGLGAPFVIQDGQRPGVEDTGTDDTLRDGRQHRQRGQALLPVDHLVDRHALRSRGSVHHQRAEVVVGRGSLRIRLLRAEASAAHVREECRDLDLRPGVGPLVDRHPVVPGGGEDLLDRQRLRRVLLSLHCGLPPCPRACPSRDAPPGRPRPRTARGGPPRAR